MKVAKETKEEAVQEQIPVEDTPKLSARDAFYGKVREAYPDDEIDDDVVYEKAGELLAGLQDFKSQRGGVDEKLKAVFDADPKLGAVFAELIEGKKPFRAILAGHYSPEDLTPQDGDDDYEAYSKTLAERKKSLTANKEQEAKMLQNIENAEKVFKSFSEDKGFDEGAMGEFSEKIQTVLQDLSDGVLTPETLSLFYKGLNYDQDTKDAAKVAEIKGRNAKIQEEIKQEPKGDGLPDTSKASKEPVKREIPEGQKWIDSVMDSKTKVL